MGAIRIMTNAKVPHRLSSYSGATENNTQKPLIDQEDLLKKTRIRERNRTRS